MSFVAAVLLVALALTLWANRRLHHQVLQQQAQLQELRQAESVGRAKVDRLEAALGGAADGLIVLDTDGVVVACNPAAKGLLGLTLPSPQGRRLVELVSWPALHEAMMATGAANVAATFEVDGEASQDRLLAVRVHVLPGLGTVIGIDDQSRLRRLESLRRDFVANVSHELKTPLAAILGFVETMIDDPAMPDATRQRFLDRIARQTERLTTLVGDLLTLSRLDEGEPSSPEAVLTDWNVVLGETVRDLQPLAERRTVALTLSLPSEPVWVRADREVLRQVAGNLIDNAIKYTPTNGTVSVHVTTRSTRVRLEVIDTGIGLSPADQERVFERFYRVDRARSRDLGGTGLGLSIVKNTVRSLGGGVGVQSVLGEGSTFWVELPCTADPSAEPSAEPSSADPTAS